MSPRAGREAGARVGYLGPRGTFTHQAAMALRPEAELIALPDAPALVAALHAGEIAGAVLPIDNSVNGPVMPTIDVLVAEQQVVISDDHALPVTFNAYALPEDETARIVVSHPHGLAQCQGYIAGLGLPTRAVSSTAAAVEELVPGEVAIAAPVCGELYDVRTVATAIEDNSVAFTTFVHLALGRASVAPDHPDRATGMLFVLRPSSDHPGALLEILQPLRDRGLNLTNIITRPVAATPGEYVFLLFVDGALAASTVEALLGFWRDELRCSARLAGPLVGGPPRQERADG